MDKLIYIQYMVDGNDSDTSESNNFEDYSSPDYDFSDNFKNVGSHH